MNFLLKSKDLSAALAETQKCLELTENLFIGVATIALVAALWALLKGA
jgi:hypothetical protein